MASTHDDAFREIQLSGKQLVFLAMAGVVIVVVIFLFGVEVGRGVRAERGGLPEGTRAVAALPGSDAPPPPASATSGSSASPVTAGEKLSYAERLGGTAPPADPLKGSAAPAGDTTPTPKPEAPPAEPARRAAAPAPVAASPEPAGAGFAIQVAALREREEADTIVKRLAGKGYPAYVLAPEKGAAPIYRVRVGKFKERREAETVAARLQKEEQFKPWVVR
jgi:cell division septation protein DedD